MITVTAYFLIFCYTNTLASCHVVAPLPTPEACDAVFAKVKAKSTGARKLQCESYPYLMVGQSGNVPACEQMGGPLCAK